MKNKKKFTFLPLVFASALMLGACGLNAPNAGNKNNSGWAPEVKSYGDKSKEPKPSSSQGQDKSSTGPVTSVTPAVKKYIVNFVVNGMPVQISEVKEGECAVYEGETPTKRGDGNSLYYRFKKWDRDIKLPITEDTTFNAIFTTYDNEAMIDNFEDYADTGSMIDEGWMALGYNNTTKTWTTDTSASVALGQKSVEGQKALRFDAWENGVGYKFAKTIREGAFPNAVNALKFRLMVPSINTVKVILHAKMTIEGKEQAPSFTYTLHPTSSEYVEYTVPLDDAGWALWGEAGKSIKEVAEWLGVHQDDVVNYLTRIEFYVEGNDGIGGQPYAAFLDSVKFVTIKDAIANQEATLNAYDRYTGKTASGNTVRIDIANNGSATAKVIDLEDPIEIPGKVVINDTNMVFTSADNGATLKYAGAITNGGQKVKFVSASGALAAEVTDMEINAVQVVDNYEQYTSDGKAYYQSNKDKSQRSGCRGAYYSEYYSGSGSSDWGGNGWNLLGGDGSQLKLKNDGAGHNGSKNYLCLKHSKSVAFRYMQWGLFDGSAETNAFRGSKLSFWARTNGFVKSFKVSMYSQSAPTNATKDTYVKAETFTETAAIGEWKHYEIDLNPNLVYYGFMLFTEKNTGLSANEAYLYLDDVEVYTANPYATYVPPQPDKLLAKGDVFFGKAAKVAAMQLDILKDNNARFKFLNKNSTDATYSYNGNRVTFDFGSNGTYVAKLNSTATKLEYVTATGDALMYFKDLNLDVIAGAETAEEYESAGTMWYQNSGKDSRSGARGAYYCDYYSGGSGSVVGGSGWSLMGGSGDQLTLNTDAANAHSGTNSLKMKRNKSNTMRYMTFGLCDGTATGHTGVSYFSYWAKNPNTVDLVIKTSVYSQAQVTPSTQQSNRNYVEATIPAGGEWTRIVIPLDANKTYYGVAYTPATVSGGGSADWFYVDDAMFYGADSNINAPYSPFNGLKLTGTIVPGAADITFGNNGEVTLTCANLGGSLQAKYQLVDQNMRITVPAANSEIIGTFIPGAGNTINFTVTSVNGQLGAAINAGTVLSATVTL